MLKKNQYETTSSYNKRQWFVKQYLLYNPKVDEEEAARLSNIWINMITLGCRYPADVEQEIKKFLEANPPN
jgi:hypothetical protein